jgi:prepilin-type N-terminal cleavage/methylation domain-containing protein
MTPRRRQRGLTLVEMIVASALTALLAGATVTMLRTMTATRTRVDRQAVLQQEARSALRAITVTLRNAYRTTGDDWDIEGIPGSAATQHADRLRLFSVSRRQLRTEQGESDVRECEFFLARSSAEALPVLVRRMDPTRNPAPDGGGIAERIAGNVVALAFAYHDGQTWRGYWKSADRTWPKAISVRLIVADENDPTVTAAASAIVGYTYPPVHNLGEVSPLEESAQETEGGDTGLGSFEGGGS